MGSIEQFLKDLGGLDVDISSARQFGPFYHHKVKPKLNSPNNEAALFFNMIISANDMINLDTSYIDKVYQASNKAHKTQLADLMIQNGKAAIERTVNEELTESFKTVINYASLLLKSEHLSFAQYLNITVYSLKLTNNPKDQETLTLMTDLSSILPKTGVCGILGAYIAIAIGNVLNILGITYGKKMIDNANAKLEINKSLQSALNAVGVFAPKPPQQDPFAENNDFVPGFD